MTNNQLTKRQQAQAAPIVAVAEFIERKREEIAKVADDPEGVIKGALLYVQSKVDLLGKCTPASVYHSVIQAAQLGLRFELSEADMVPFRNKQAGTSEATLMVGYRGWAKIARRTPGIDVIHASVVYSNDLFEAWELPPKLEHKRAFGERGDLVCSVAAAYRQGPHGLELVDYAIMDKTDLQKAKRLADARRPSAAWRDWYDRMAEKSAIKRLCQRLPRTPAVRQLEQIESHSQQVEIESRTADKGGGESVLHTGKRPPALAEPVSSREPGPDKAAAIDAELDDNDRGIGLSLSKAINDLAKGRKADLVDQCERLGLETKGSKSALAERIIMHNREAFEALETEGEPAVNSKDNPNSNQQDQQTAATTPAQPTGSPDPIVSQPDPDPQVRRSEFEVEPPTPAAEPTEGQSSFGDWGVS